MRAAWPVEAFWGLKQKGTVRWQTVGQQIIGQGLLP